ncbi:ABC transporter permease [Feifania hominis]|uniref:ABC transporter permease n=1 Tax=Feifania hominis TaxID=2763660 RepID=A0A926DE61_9FIRM|nr:ABC transporter permease [Feifania hominis]MBC8535380.1 ABC transporter permease [Feifania hominis]
MNPKLKASTIGEEFVIKAAQEQRTARLVQIMPVIVLAALVLFFSVACPGSFLTLYNLRTILNQLSGTLIIAVGITFVILTGSVDLSVDGVVGLAGSLLSVIVLNSKNANNLGFWGVLIAVAVGVACGFASGLLHVKLKISSFMVTYAMSAVAKGLAIMSYGGLFASIHDPVLLSIPSLSLLGIPLITWIAFAVFAVALVIQRRTPFGRHMYAVGTNEAIPRMTGVNVNSVKIRVFMWAGGCMAIAGVLAALRLGSGLVDIGLDQFFPAQAAVVIGGTSLSGGRGGVVNTLVGSLVVTVLNVGLLLMGVNTYIRTGIQGLIIVAAVALTVMKNGRAICK